MLTNLALHMLAASSLAASVLHWRTRNLGDPDRGRPIRVAVIVAWTAMFCLWSLATRGDEFIWSLAVLFAGFALAAVVKTGVRAWIQGDCRWSPDTGVCQGPLWAQLTVETVVAGAVLASLSFAVLPLEWATAIPLMVLEPTDWVWLTARQTALDEQRSKA